MALLATRHIEMEDNADAKKSQGVNPESTSSAYGTPSGPGTRTSKLNTIVKTSIVKKGRNTAHKIPTAVCL